MNRKKHETFPKRKNVPVIAILLLIALLGAATGGVVAYLSTSTDSVTNEFSQALAPVVAVQENNSIKIEDPGYAVYLRAAVVVNWKNDDHILAEIPKENTDYTITPGNGWKKIDSFYYYQSAVMSETTTSPVVQVTKIKEKKGYDLEVNVAVQAVQAVGTTDNSPEKSAVEDAWGISAADFIQQ